MGGKNTSRAVRQKMVVGFWIVGDHDKLRGEWSAGTERMSSGFWEKWIWRPELWESVKSAPVEEEEEEKVFSVTSDDFENGSRVEFTGALRFTRLSI